MYIHQISSMRSGLISAICIFVVCEGLKIQVPGTVPRSTSPQGNNSHEPEISPLFLACESGDAKTVEHLLKQGADPNQIADKKRGMTALAQASAQGHADVVKILLKSGADHLKTGQILTPLMHAAFSTKGRPAIPILLEHDSTPKHVNKQDGHGWTALNHAVSRNNGETQSAQILLDYGADVSKMDIYGYTALMEAAGKGYQNLVELLLAHPQNLDLISIYGQSVLDIASRRNSARHKAIQKMLLARGAKTAAQIKGKGEL